MPVPDTSHCSSLLCSLNFAADVARDFLIPVPEEWVDCAKKVKVPFDAEKQYHPEYDGYSPGERGSSCSQRKFPVWCPLPRGSGQVCGILGAVPLHLRLR